MLAIFRMARNCYPSDPERLFVHQFGDGFLIVSEFHEQSLERCVTIAVALMRHVAACGLFARATIAEGEIAGIEGCYPREVLACLDGDSRVRLHDGLMTITPVMGTALIRAVRLDKKGPKGPLVLIEATKAQRLGGIPHQVTSDGEYAVIDWVHSEPSSLAEVQKVANIRTPSEFHLEESIKQYVAKNDLPPAWKESVREFLMVDTR